MGYLNGREPHEYHECRDEALPVFCYPQLNLTKGRGGYDRWWFYLLNIKICQRKTIGSRRFSKAGTEKFRKAKEGINKEGWEDNAAVIIGTKRSLRKEESS